MQTRPTYRRNFARHLDFLICVGSELPVDGEATTMGYRRGNELVAYTMAALNYQFKLLYPSKFMALRQQPGFPEELRSPSAWTLVPPRMR